jgi:type II secretory pathway component PulF
MPETLSGPTVAPPLVFRYRAIELATGRVRSGEQSGESAYAVRASLRRVGLEVEQLVPLATGAPPRWLRPLQDAWHARQRRQRRLQKADLCDGLATLVQAGVPLEQAVGSLAASPSRPEAERRMLRTLRERLREGLALNEACALFPDWFDRLDLALIAAGQHAGDLAGTLVSVGQYHLRAGAIGQKLLIALAYPAILLIAGIAVVEFMSFQTLPQLMTLITQAHRTPPWLTASVVAFGQGLAYWWPLVLAAVIALVIGVRSLCARVPLDSALGHRLHGNPIARARSRMRVAQLSLSLARLRRTGMPLTDALTVVADTVGERALQTLLREGVEAIRRGEDLSAVIGRSALLDPEFAQLLQLGERSGELTEMLERIADRYQRAADRASDRLTAVLAPIAILILAALIGVVVIACALPLVQLGDLV